MTDMGDTRILILHGDDEYGIDRELRKIITSFNSTEMGELNVSRLDAAVDRPEEIQTAVHSIPFFTPQRLVVLDNPLPAARAKKGEAEDEGVESDTVERGSAAEKKKRLITLLDTLPETTRLVMVIGDESKYDWSTKNTVWSVLKETHYLVKWVREHAQIAGMKSFALPRPAEMVAWVRQEGSARGLRFSEEAATELVAYTGNDTRQASQEVEKLDLYLGKRREVQLEDISAICTFSSSAKIWQMLEALGARDTRKALDLHHQLLESNDPAFLFIMLIGHFRQLLWTREAQAAGPVDQQSLSVTLKVQQFQAKNLIKQAAAFSRSELRHAYRLLMSIEEDSKSGEVNMVERLDAFITRVTARA
jgi:DNA polymerase-3 subunit delta